MEDPLGFKVVERLGRVGGNPQGLQAGSVAKFPRRTVSQQKIKEERGEGVLQCWDAQWQEFLKKLESPHSEWGNPQLPEEPRPWDDAKAFLASFEEVAEACRWPREEWVAQLLPALSGQAKWTFSNLDARDQTDYAKVKVAILKGDAASQEKQRQHFRRFCYQEAEGPRGAYSRLQALCCRWLKAERRTKEQILEMLILEQFLTVLPPEVQNWVRECGPETCLQAVAMAEDFLQRQQEAASSEQQELMTSRDVAVGLLSTKQTSPNPGWNQLQREAKEESNCAVIIPADYKEVNDQNGRSNLYKKDEEIESRWISQQRPHEDPSQRCHDAGRNIQNQLRSKEQQANHIRKRARFSASSGLDRKLLGENLLLQSEKADTVPREGFPQDLGEHVQDRLIHKCSVCGKTFSQNLHLLFHQRTHDMEKPYKCTQCESSFHSRQGFVYHQRSHAGEKPYKCAFCGKTFSQSSHLLVHKRSHTGEKPFKCPTCGKCFSRNSLLTIHERTHTGEKPYKCCQCGSRFHSGSGLINHKRIHAGIKPFKCAKCGRDFIRKAHLTRHQNVHGEDKTKT